MIAENQRDKFFLDSLIKALILHFACCMFFIIFNTLKKMFIPQTKIEIIESSVRVDVVGMPEFTVQELKKLKVNPSTTKMPVVKEDEIKIPDESTEESKSDEVTDSKSSSMNDLLSSLSKKKLPKSKKKAKKKISSNKLRSLVLEGNKVSEGQSVIGKQSSASQSDFAKYTSNIPNHVKPHWVLPSYLSEKDLKCRISVYIGSNGNLLRTKIWESSGDPEYDQKAIFAIKAASPFPKPEESILGRVAGGDIVLGFPL